jgi:serine/threonine-protein kinase
MVENGSNVRLMDLGISRMNGGNKFSSLGFIGTPEYSAPEQIHGKEQINATTDIYELGITFYELLTGVNPMSCESETDTLTKQTKEPLPANPLIPKKLMRVIWKATEKEQAKRYQTALDFKRAIQQALMPDPSKWEQFKTWAESHVLLLVAAVVGFLLVVALIIILILTFV